MTSGRTYFSHTWKDRSPIRLDFPLARQLKYCIQILAIFHWKVRVEQPTAEGGAGEWGLERQLNFTKSAGMDEFGEAIE